MQHDKITLLKEMGFFEKDGWLCNPNLDGEAIFKLGDPIYGPENKTLSWIMSVISSTAFNAGSRWGQKNTEKDLIEQLERFTKNLKVKKILMMKQTIK